MEKLSEDLIPNYILEDLHEFIYDECNSADVDIDDNDNGVVNLEYEKDNWFFNIEVECSFRYIDDSFTHEFGTYYDGHWEFDSIDNIGIDAYYCDYDKDIELEVEFPYSRFTKKLFKDKNDSDEKRKLNLQKILAHYES